MTEQTGPLLPDATANLAAFAARLRFEDIPDLVIDKIKLSILDSIGCCIFGVTLPWTQRVEEMVRAEGAREVASVYGGRTRTSIANAVLVNGTAGHAFELDDIHKESILHPGSIAVPVAFAFAEASGDATGQDIITSIVAGYEVGIRIGNAATMNLFFRGFHPQGASGVFIATASAGKCLDLDAGRMQHALGIAGSQAGGLMAAQEGAMVKRFHAGRAAQSGVYSALLAREGFTGTQDVLEAGYGGFLSTYSGAPNPKRLTDGLGEVWETALIGYKPHASVTSIHSAQDALLALMQEAGVSPDDIESVDVKLSTMTHVHCAWEYKAQGVTAAQMNLFYGLAVIAVDGVAFVDQYNEKRLSDPRLLHFIEKIKASVDPDIDGRGAAFRHAAKVSITTSDGRVFSRAEWNRRGSPDNPISRNDVVNKFRNVVSSCLSSSDIKDIINIVDNFEGLEDIKPIMDILNSRTH
ncbi:MmgE/PrpD family protein [Pseudochelatococcus sp. B33]